MDIQRNSGVSSFPAKVCYNAAISACERSSYWEMAVSLLQWLPAADGISVGAVTNACARGTSLSLEKLTAGLTHEIITTTLQGPPRYPEA